LKEEYNFPADFDFDFVFDVDTILALGAVVIGVDFAMI
jgi:hypothetical protein